MQVESHHINHTEIAEVIADGLIINSAEEGVDLLGDLYYQNFDSIILYEKNLNPDFFDLKTGLAGEILQKFSNYRIRLAIVGDFAKYTGKSIRDFIKESNRGKQVSFIDSKEEALKLLGG